jgi:hypothetical protein
MAQQNVAPKADQPRVTTGSLKSGERSPNLEYRVSGAQNFDRGPKARTYGRTVRG